MPFARERKGLLANLIQQRSKDLTFRVAEEGKFDGQRSGPRSCCGAQGVDSASFSDRTVEFQRSARASEGQVDGLAVDGGEAIGERQIGAAETHVEHSAVPGGSLDG